MTRGLCLRFLLKRFWILRGFIAAPEVLMGGTYNAVHADIFSLGVVLFMMVSGHPPFNWAIPGSDLKYKTLFINRSDLFWQTHFRIDVQNTDRFSDSLQELIVSMLSFNPAHRPSLSEIMKSPWYTSGFTILSSASTEPPSDSTSAPVTEQDAKTHLKGLKESIAKENSKRDEECPDLSFDHPDVDYRSVKRSTKQGMSHSVVIPERECKQFRGSFHSLTRLFSQSDPEELLHAITYFAKEIH